MIEPLLTQRHLDRALLARQLLLERSQGGIPEALEQVGGLQTQYAPSGYVGLWTRMAGFERADLTRALEERSVIQATLMRGTIHLVSAREYWLFAMGIRRARREWQLRLERNDHSAGRAQRHDEDLRRALSDGPRTVAELGGLASGFVGNVGLWVDLVRVPPSGTWERRRADTLALAEDWVGPCEVTEEQGLDHLVRSYLRGFGPAPLRDISSWAGVPVRPLKSAAERLGLRRLRDESGRELLDVAGAPLPDPDTPAPVRFLPHWDANLLVHARRTGLVPEPYRPLIFTTKNPFSVGVFLVDGIVAGAWSVRDGHVRVEPYEDLSSAVRREVDAEAARLDAFHRGDGRSEG
ncbi:MAG: winged helix DNA-binding domain-containing protein [Chloroflexi bacterium]|nr:winged helix DNA-binding domain-containing protein [Chloroflexota bacterium]